MERVLAGYVRALRAAGAEASPAEAIDAARAVALLGYASRADLKTALGLALAKSAAEQQIHERVFERYFSSPAGWTGDPADIDRQGALMRAAAEVGVDDIQLYTQAPRLAQRLAGQVTQAPQAAQAAQVAQVAQAAEAAQAAQDSPRLEGADAPLRRDARALVDQRFELYGRPATERFMTEVAVHRPLGRMAPEDLVRMKAAVARMARKLAARHARRQRVQRRGRLDLRRTLRANAGHDGAPFTLAFQHRRRDSPRLVAVCDVSGSMAAQARFLLMFLYALHGLPGGIGRGPGGGLRSYAFSRALQEVGAPLETLPFDDAMALILKQAGAGSTDYGQAWVDLHAHHLDGIDRRTTLLVLGDGRGNGSPPRLDLFAQLAERAKRVIWLSPEAPGRWGTGDSDILRYRPYCDALTHCATAADLERALDEALAAYH